MIDYSQKTNVNLRHLRAAITVAERQSFSAAAIELNVAASALTETIKQLERDVGVPLFDRTTRRVEVTALGRRFIDEARRVLADFNNCMLEMRAFGGLARGRVKVAAAPSMMAHVVIPALSAFKERHKDIEVHLADDNAESVARLVLDGEADFGLAGQWGRMDDLLYRQIGSDDYGLVCSSEHRLATRKTVSLADLEPERVVALAPQTGIRNALEEINGLTSHLWSSDIEASSSLTLTMLLKQNIGVAIMPELAAQIPSMGTLAFVPIEDLDLRRDLFMITRNRRSMTPAATAFATEVFRVAQSSSEALKAPDLYRLTSPVFRS